MVEAWENLSNFRMTDMRANSKIFTSAKFKEVFLSLADELDCKRSEVPARLGISYNIYFYICELGKLPRPQVLARIADAFGCSADYLLGRTQVNCFVPAKTRRTFSGQLAALKEKYGKTDYAIAARLHVSTGYLTNWRKKNYTPSWENLIVLSEIFDTSLDYLLGRTDDDAPYPVDPDWN